MEKRNLTVTVSGELGSGTTSTAAILALLLKNAGVDVHWDVLDVASPEDLIRQRIPEGISPEGLTPEGIARVLAAGFAPQIAVTMQTEQKHPRMPRVLEGYSSAEEGA